MPQFKTNQNIFKDFGDEVWNDNNMDSDKIMLPPSPDWSYDRIMEIEDVEVWEVIIERGGGTAVYAAWCPYAEFYMVRHSWGEELEVFYGRFVQPQVLERIDELKIPYSKSSHFRFMDKFNDKNYNVLTKGRSSV
jgi:hypothetical protein|tara:strand:+ start:3159 stop:3563 length:405 start_codon:yes stop_codon:yes gene_type:complete